MTGRGRTRVVLGLLVVLLALTSTLIIGGLLTGFGRISTIPVASCAPGRSSGQTVQVSLTDGGGMMGPALMMLGLHTDPQSVAAGPVTFLATNHGRLDHELVVLPMSADGLGTRPVGADGKIEESASLGVASRSCASGVGDGIAPGSRSWVTIDLRSGTYELVCDEPWHYANGMDAAFTVIRS